MTLTLLALLDEVYLDPLSASLVSPITSSLKHPAPPSSAMSVHRKRGSIRV